MVWPEYISGPQGKSKLPGEPLRRLRRRSLKSETDNNEPQRRRDTEIHRNGATRSVGPRAYARVATSVFSVSLWFKNGGTQTGNFPESGKGNHASSRFRVARFGVGVGIGVAIGFGFRLRQFVPGKKANTIAITIAIPIPKISCQPIHVRRNLAKKYCGSGQAKILDFGLVKLPEEHRQATETTVIAGECLTSPGSVQECWGIGIHSPYISVMIRLKTAASSSERTPILVPSRLLLIVRI